MSAMATVSRQGTGTQAVGDVSIGFWMVTTGPTICGADNCVVV